MSSEEQTKTDTIHIITHLTGAHQMHVRTTM